MICALAFIHVVSVVINQYSVIRHSFSLFAVGDMISLLKCWNERPNSRAEALWAQLSISVSALLGSPCRSRRRSVRLLTGLQTHFLLQPREAAEFQFHWQLRGFCLRRDKIGGGRHGTQQI